MRSRYFWEYQPFSSNITRCQVPSRVRAWFNDSAGNIDFYQMFLSQSESTTFIHESIIWYIRLSLFILRLANTCKNIVCSGEIPTPHWFWSSDYRLRSRCSIGIYSVVFLIWYKPPNPHARMIRIDLKLKLSNPPPPPPQHFNLISDLY